MLVLSRKAGESVRIGRDVRVTVVAVSGGQVRLSVEAPDSVAIHREEVFERILAANRQAARPTCESLEALEGAASDRPATGGEGVEWRNG